MARRQLRAAFRARVVLLSAAWALLLASFALAHGIGSHQQESLLAMGTIAWFVLHLVSFAELFVVATLASGRQMPRLGNWAAGYWFVLVGVVVLLASLS